MDAQAINKPLKVESKILPDFRKNHEVLQMLDTYQDQLRELFLIRNPHFRFNPEYQDALEKFFQEHQSGRSWEAMGSWFYFPWNKMLVHFLPDQMHQELRTARNKNIITKEEQAKLQDFKVGVGGLSVGSHAVSTMAMMGVANNLKIADNDTISGSNLNRIRTDFTMVGVKKADAMARFIYQLNPYTNLEVYGEGINPENLADFMEKPFRLDILVDELDNLEMKVRMRQIAREMSIPVVMATDNGDNAIVDIERYDLDKNTKLFNGAIDESIFNDFSKINPQELPRMALQVAGPELVVPRMLESLLDVGKTLYSWPQLGDAATLSGVAIAYLVKKIALGLPVDSGKYEINLDSIFTLDFSSPASVEGRRAERVAILQKFGPAS